VAKHRLDRIVDADIATRRVAIDPRAHRPARAANDNGMSAARSLDQLWPLAAALLVLAWALLSVFS
jgi:hypothetical protein